MYESVCVCVLVCVCVHVWVCVCVHMCVCVCMLLVHTQSILEGEGAHTGLYALMYHTRTHAKKKSTIGGCHTLFDRSDTNNTLSEHHTLM